MRSIIGLTLIVVIGFAGWEVGNGMSSDAIAMALGVMLGVLAGIPMALLLMAGNRRQGRREEREDFAESAYPAAYGRGQWAGAPPVIVVAGAPGGGATSPQLPEPAYWTMPSAGQDSRPARQFKVVGEREEFLDEW